jgi:hypothetical protein
MDVINYAKEYFNNEHCWSLFSMLYIKNKATQLLMIRDLRPSKHYLV